MAMIQAKVKKWGNSFGVIIPSETIEAEKIKENQEIKILIVKDSREAFRKTFGMLKGKLKKSSQKIKDELRDELYDD